MTKIKCLFSWVIWLSACQSTIVPITQRNVGIDKLSGNVLSSGSSRIDDSDKNSSTYVAKKKVQITKRPTNTTGSLYIPSSGNNELFRDNIPLRPGDIVDIRIASMRMEKKEGLGIEDKKSKDTKKPGEKESPSESGKSDEVVDAMRKALPDLDMPAGQFSALKFVKFRVMEVDDSGNAKVAYRRASQNQTDNKEILVTAVLPKERMAKNDGPSTNDLTVVKWDETDAGQRIERSSDQWEDEYTLRLSGFSEARSRVALELEAKKQQMMEIRKQLETKLIGFKAEREQLSKDRLKLDDMRQNMEKENRELKAQAEKAKQAVPPSASTTAMAGGDQGQAKNANNNPATNANAGGKNETKAP